MQSLDGREASALPRHWGIPLALAAVAFVVMALGNDAAEMLRYQREAILDGGFWRMLSGHLVHLGWAHLWLNLTGLGLIWVLTGDAYTGSGWGLQFFSCALITSMGLLLLNPELEWYVGLSGVLHGLLLAGLLARLISGHRDALLLMGVLLLKLAWEQLYGPLPGSEASVGDTVVVDAHLYGAIGGGIGTSLLLGVPRWRGRFLQ